MKNTVEFKAEGMTCHSCEKLIKQTALSMEGVQECEVDYVSQKGKITYESDKISIEDIYKKLKETGYICSSVNCADDYHNCPSNEASAQSKEHTKECRQDNKEDDFIITLPRVPQILKNKNLIKKLGIIFALIGAFVIFYFLSQFSETIRLPQISANMGYGLVFLTGLLTGLHCVTMCGGFVFSYSANPETNKNAKNKHPHLRYAVGKIISYTLIGTLFGFIGSAITFTPEMRGVSGVIAGAFLIIFGLKMLNVFAPLRKFSISVPAVETFIAKLSARHSSPLIIGLLNGLMIACGPLQAMYIAAAGTGSAVEGAKLLFFFALGTLPFMLGFGYLTSRISAGLKHKLLKLSGVAVIVFGLIMLNNGVALTGTGYDIQSIFANVAAGTSTTGFTAATTTTNEGYQEIRMDVTASGWNPDKFVLKKGVPVKWIINGKEITGCNKAIQVPKLGLNFDIKKGEQTIEFTPNESGIIPWSCWMGMIQGTFIVKDDIDVTDEAAVQKELAAVPAQKSSGGCGCGSDIRFKDDIELVEGSKYNRIGLNGYTWRWNDLAFEILGVTGKGEGVIAQEVIKLYPDAVYEENGYFMVRYDLLDKLVETKNYK